MKTWKNEIVAKMIERAQGDRIVPLREVAEAAGITHIDRQDAADIIRAALAQLPDYREVLLTNSPHDSYAQAVTLIENGVEFEDEEDEEQIVETRRYGDTKTALTLTDKAQWVVDHSEPLTIMEIVIKSRAGHRYEYTYAFGQFRIGEENGPYSEEELNEILEEIYDEDHEE